MVLTGCKGGQSIAGRLLESIIEDNGTSVSRVDFEYDNENRVVKMRHYLDGQPTVVRMVVYTGNNLSTIWLPAGDENEEYKQITEYVVNKNTISVHPPRSFLQEIIVGRNGYITQTKSGHKESDWSGLTTYHYKRGNLNKQAHTSFSFYTSEVVHGYEIEHKYSKEKSPFNYGNTPKWLIQRYFSLIDGGYRNNIKQIEYKSISENQITTFEHEFGSDGYSIKRTEYFNGRTTKTTHFVYK